MFEVIFSDIREAVELVWTDSSTLTLVLLGIVALGQGVLMKHWGEAFGKASQGLLLFGILAFIVHQLVPQGEYNMEAIGDSFVGAWASVMAMTIKGILGYLLMLFIGVLAVFGITSIIRKML